jgi:excisionase family DNA binding protein
MPEQAEPVTRKHAGAFQALLTTKEAARLLGVSASFLERDRWEGARIPFVRVGRRAVRYDPQVIANFLRAQTGQSTSDAAGRRRDPRT